MKRTRGTQTASPSTLRNSAPYTDAAQVGTPSPGLSSRVRAIVGQDGRAGAHRRQRQPGARRAGSNARAAPGRVRLGGERPAGIGGNARAALSEHAQSARGGKAPAEPASGVDLGPASLPPP